MASAPDLLSLPEAGRQKLADFINECELQCAWPWQLLAITIALLPKEAGGTRPIGLIPFICRLLLRCRRPCG